MREKIVHRWMVVLFLTLLIGTGNLGMSGEVVAGGTFDVPGVNDHFDQVNPVPQPQKPASVTNPDKEEGGTWDWITEPITDAWEWTKDKASAAWNWTKETASVFWDGIVDVSSKIAEVTVDSLTAAWDWILEHKGIVVAIISILGAIVTVIGFVVGSSLALFIGGGILAGELISGLLSWILGNKLFSDEMLFDMLVGGIAGGISALFGLAAGAGAAGSSVVRWLGTRIPWLGRIFPKMFGGGVAAGVDQSLWDLLKNGKINWMRTAIATGLGFVLVFGGETLGSHSDDIIKSINRINISPVTQYFADGTTTAPKFIGDTPLGQWLQKFGNDSGGSEARQTVSNTIQGYRLPHIHPDAGRVNRILDDDGNLVRVEIVDWQGNTKSLPRLDRANKTLSFRYSGKSIDITFDEQLRICIFHVITGLLKIKQD
ncbi:hypothetical protein [Thermoactinomyces mirandus]|uniref:Uncharacterized protein n=1 Tax=Thermoactinomyces mirandus TaxID=2756294 RepID=A0A7W1XS16_9BACL|nr:hypothetical protein [Thermoactinomyces mirandus]MBA4602072.1 hypothetical protein [Thermoactinomyces mirandus]